MDLKNVTGGHGYVDEKSKRIRDDESLHARVGRASVGLHFR